MRQTKNEAVLARLGARIRSALSDDLRSSRYRGQACSTAGHCYVASEAAYHAMGGSASGFTPQFVRHEGEPHWYLKGFLTKEPSKRARVILERIAHT